MPFKTAVTNMRVSRETVRVLKHNANLRNQTLTEFTQEALSAGLRALGAVEELPGTGAEKRGTEPGNAREIEDLRI